MNARRLAALVKSRDWYGVRRAVVMPEEWVKRRTLGNIQRKFRASTFIETGTYLGGTAKYMSRLVPTCVTIELDPILAQRAAESLSTLANVKCVQGSSAPLLREIIPTLSGPFFFWLDAHYSGGSTAYGPDPIEDELAAIEEAKVNSPVIVIDDISDYCKAYSDIRLETILERLARISPASSIYFDYDMLICLPEERQAREFWRELALPVLIR